MSMHLATCCPLSAWTGWWQYLPFESFSALVTLDIQQPRSAQQGRRPIVCRNLCSTLTFPEAIGPNWLASLTYPSHHHPSLPPAVTTHGFSKAAAMCMAMV